MPRCSVCDYCSEIDSDGRKIFLDVNARNSEYVCSVCASSILASHQDFHEEGWMYEYDMERLAFLEDSNMGDDTEDFE